MGGILSKSKSRSKRNSGDEYDPNDLTQQIRKTKPTPSRTGGFSDIWEGEYTPAGNNKNPQVVAIKVLRAVHLGDGQTADSADTQGRLDKRLKREMHVWKPLKHPRIVPFIGHAYLDNSPCLVMPWYENGNAKDYVANHPDCNRKALVRLNFDEAWS